MVQDFTRGYAETRDASDPLAHYRGEFYLPQDGIYMDGNSLGLLSKRAEKTLLESLSDWKELGIDGWMSGRHPWFNLSEELAALNAPLIGASADEVMVTGSTTVNLHQLAATFFKPVGKRTKILADALTFPSDIYALQSQLLLRDLDPAEHLVQVPSRDGRYLNEDDIIAAMTDDIALIVLPTVLYRSGQILDMARLAKAAHERDILIGFDACHSVGAIPHAFHDWGVDFAYWCNYKHLNGGPGSVGGLFVHERHFGTTPGLAGWFGSRKDKQFDMDHTMTPAEHAGAFQIGTPHVMSLAPQLGALEMFNEVGMEAIREKSLALTTYMTELIDELLAPHGFVIGSPRDEKRRGAHLSLEHPEAARICKALKQHRVIPDFRAPNIIRLAPVALYNTFTDVYDVVMILKAIMDNKEYEAFENVREVVA
ncbi:kynureninase [Exiguobacterium sp. SH31]|uniref:kynureninase n=1 Tax=Exiguobacterium TaxID=33986 RepID=UPI0008B0A2F2|nr:MULTISPECIES: kynureninase [Exiguobacterium]OGX79289.1 kynureninase [Exiguobacterium sp. SH31]TCI70366.1 kynureninase [Exiguobacterium sp. SH0S7]